MAQRTAGERRGTYARASCGATLKAPVLRVVTVAVAVAVQRSGTSLEQQRLPAPAFGTEERRPIIPA